MLVLPAGFSSQEQMGHFCTKISDDSSIALHDSSTAHLYAQISPLNYQIRRAMHQCCFPSLCVGHLSLVGSVELEAPR
jgi:hypothetical protein